MNQIEPKYTELDRNRVN